MKKKLEVRAFINDTNMSPIMVVDGNKVLSLDLALKRAIDDGALNVVTGRHGRKYGYGWPWKNERPAYVKQVESPGSATEVAPHTKKVKITIEIED